MFPSAANISDETSKKDVSNSKSWLQNASYQPRVSQLSPEKAHKKHSTHKSLKRPHRQSVDELKDSKEEGVDFFIDIDGNPALLKFGCTYEGDVALFNENVKMPILGCRGNLRPIDFEPELLKKEVKRNISKRYFSKKNRVLIAKPTVLTTPSIATSKESPQSFYTILQEGPISRSEPVPTVSQHSEHIQRTADLNRAVYDTPQDIKSWLQLVQLQLSEGSEDSHQEDFSSDRGRFVVLERQLAIVERAVEKNPGNLRLRLLKASMYEYATELIASGACRGTDPSEGLKHKDKMAREWYDLVRVCPQFVNVWRGYLAHLRGRFALFGTAGEGGQAESFSRIDGLYRRALDTLSGLVAGRIVSHRPTENTADEAVDLLAEYCQWLSQTGFTERAFSIWQAVIEFTCFCPSHLQSRDLPTSSERRSEFQRFWMAPDRGPVFGIPGAIGWAAWSSGKTRGTARKFIDAPGFTDSDPLLAEIEEDWSSSSSTAKVRWNRVVKDWNDVSEAAEDALLNFGSLSNSQNSDNKAHHSGEGSLSNRRSRGLAWLGLERARESVGWLPAEVTMDDPSVLEDTERLPKFEDIEPFLLEVHLDPRITDEAVLQQRKQRLILLFLEFLGVWEAEIARMYKLPAGTAPSLTCNLVISNTLSILSISLELQQLYELSSVSCLQRQTLNPRQFGFPWLRPGLETGNTGSSISFRMRSILASSCLEQASHLFPNDATWQSSIKRLRFYHLAASIERALARKLITPKSALALWRKKAKGLLTQSQNDLSLWLAYARGITQSASALPEVKSLLFAEARKVFTSTLRMYPIPAEISTSPEECLGILLPRLRVLQAFVEFELGVNFPIDQIENLSRVECFNRALHLLQHAAVGGAFIPFEEEGHSVSAFPSGVDQLELRLEALCGQSPQPSQTNALSELASIFASLRLYLQLITQDEADIQNVCEKIFRVLRRIDNPTAGEDELVGAGYASRCFLHLALPALSSVSFLSQRNRASLTGKFLHFMSTVFDITKTMPLLTSPSAWTYLLPFKVAVNCGTYVDRTCTIEYQRRLQGLLPPLVLSSLESRLLENVRGVCVDLTHYITANCSRETIRPHRFDQAPPLSMEPARLLGLSSSQQAELTARLLPSSLDLLCVGLELEHWTSLVAGTAPDSSTAENPLSHHWIQGAVPRIRAAFERALTTMSNPMLRFGSNIPCLALTLTPSFWTDHLRVVLWSAYMAFEWALAGGGASLSNSTDSDSASFDAHRKQRTAFKAVFYRAVEDIPWAKVLYTDLARYCPEDAEEVVELLTSKELRLRTYLEEVDLLLTSKIP
ncbi:hypothetical protein Aperf_G00000009347 [Anoplocephala perfoliata]